MRRSMDDQPGGQAGRKKGAHYTAPMPSGALPRTFRPRRRAAHLILRCCIGIFAAFASVPPGFAVTRAENDAQKAESELQAVKTEIGRITRQVSGEQVERDRLTRELRSA